jgi:Ca-activated chloride channel family protein
MMASLCKACLLAFFAFHAIAQDSNPRVTVPLIALGLHHRPASVSIESLVITDQKTPVRGAALIAGADLPLELGVLIDISNSRRGAYLGETLKAMNEFVTETIRGPEDRVFLLTFAETAQMTDWLKKDQLQNTTVQVGVGGTTALYDSLAIACQQRLGTRNGTKPTRRVLVLVSDGGDNRSRRTLGDAISEAQKAGAVIFSIDTLIRTRSQEDKDRILEYLAEQTGGEFFDGVAKEEIPTVFTSIKELIGRMYYVTYAPPSPPIRGFHEVVLKAAGSEKLQLSYARKYLWNP